MGFFFTAEEQKHHITLLWWRKEEKCLSCKLKTAKIMLTGGQKLNI